MQWYYHKVIVVCQQPNYFPWLGYLEQCARADTLVLLDSVQWIKRGWQHRARILRTRMAPTAPHDCPAGRPQNPDNRFQWLTVPVESHGHREKQMNELAIAPPATPRPGWADAHWRTLQTVYGKRPYFKTQLEPYVKPWLEKHADESRLSTVLASSVSLCLKLLDLNPHILFSSQLPESGAKSERLVSLCQAVGASTYYSGIASTRYIDHAAFRAANIRLLWQHWRHPTYDQGRDQGRPAFTSHLSILDALANVSIDELKTWLAPPRHAITLGLETNIDQNLETT